MAIAADFLAEKGRSYIKPVWWLDIAGIRVRFGSTSPSWSPADSGTNRPIRAAISDIVDIGGQEVEPLDGQTTGHTLTVELLDRDDEITALFGSFERSNVTEVNGTFSKVETSLPVKDSSVFSYPCAIYVGRETMWATEAADPTHITVQRAMFGSVAETWYDLELKEVRDVPPFMLTRDVALYESRDGLDEADSVLLRGYIANAICEDEVWQIEIEGHLWRLKTKIGENLFTCRLRTALVGSREEKKRLNQPHSIFQIEVDDVTGFEQEPGYVTIDSEIIEFQSVTDDGGSGADYGHLQIASPDLSDNLGWIPLWTGRGILSEEIFGRMGTITEEAIDGNGDPVMSNRPTFADWHDIGAEVREVLSHQALINGSLDNDPITVALALMTSTGLGTNGDYDVLPYGWGAGIDEALVDVAGFEAMRDRYHLNSLRIKFFITEPEDLGEWLQENIFRPCLLFPLETLEGKISIGRLFTNEEAAGQTYYDIDDGVMLSMPRIEQDSAPFGEFKFQMNYYPPSDEYLGTIRVILGGSRAKYSQIVKNFEVDCRVLYDPFAAGSGHLLQASEIGDLPEYIRQYVDPIWQRYSEVPPPKITCGVPYNRACDFQAGAVCRFSSAVLPNPKTGARGISQEFCQVIRTEPDPGSESIELTLEMICVHTNNYRKIAPSGKIASYNPTGGFGGLPRITLVAGHFSGDDDAALFSKRDKIILIDAQYRHVTGSGTPEVCEIDDIRAAHTIDLAAAPTDAPSAGDFIDTAPYDDAVTAQTDEWAFQADTTPALGAADDDPDVRL